MQYYPLANFITVGITQVHLYGLLILDLSCV